MSTVIDPSKVNLRESDIEEYLWRHHQVIAGNSWYLEGWQWRQLRLPSGIADLVGMSNWGNLVVVEVKNVPVTAEAITQVMRYAFDIQNMLYCVPMADGQDYLQDMSLHKVIVAPDIDTQRMRECEACGVQFLEFEVELSLTIDRQSWTKDFQEERDSQYAELGNREETQQLYQMMNQYWCKRLGFLQIVDGQIKEENIEVTDESGNGYIPF